MERVAANPARHGLPHVLRGRGGECATLDGLLEGVRGGRSAALVVYGEAGVGKTALLRYAAESAADMRVVRAVGVESEMELAFAALHQLCEPLLDRLGHLPDPQRDALETAFGLIAGAAPDRFLVGLAVLSLLSEAAEERPLIWVVDDAQWLDRASAQVLAFAARRLLAESVLILFATREAHADFRGLPELALGGLRDADARELLPPVMRRRPAWSPSGRGSGSAIRWCVRLSTGRPRGRIASRRTECWRRSPIHGLIPTAGPGTGLRPPRTRTRTSRRNSSGPRAGRRRAAASQPRRPSSSVRPS